MSFTFWVPPSVGSKNVLDKIMLFQLLTVSKICRTKTANYVVFNAFLGWGHTLLQAEWVHSNQSGLSLMVLWQLHCTFTQELIILWIFLIPCNYILAVYFFSLSFDTTNYFVLRILCNKANFLVQVQRVCSYQSSLSNIVLWQLQFRFNQ